MSLSIVTPHYNDFDGLLQIYSCLKKQDSCDWEWIIVDDFSDESVIFKVDNWIKSIVNNNVKFVKNGHKSNASACRNIGLEKASFEKLIFLDADDFIGEKFVTNRNIVFKDFAVFPNYNVVGKNDTFTKRLTTQKQDLLNSYFAAQFLWQTSCILWNKQFLIKIGGFDSNLERLQDVELFIRALITSKKYKVLNNEIDFFYCAQPIRLKSDIVKKSCNSVNYLISKLQVNYNLDKHQQSLIKAYYYACVKGLHRCKNSKNTIYVRESLIHFYKRKYINLFSFFIGMNLLFFYQFHIISSSLFLKINRYVFK